MTRIIEIIVTPEGKTSLQTLGFTGSSCREASCFMEQALGQKTAELRTSEWYQAAEVTQQQSNKA